MFVHANLEFYTSKLLQVCTALLGSKEKIAFLLVLN